MNALGKRCIYAIGAQGKRPKGAAPWVCRRVLCGGGQREETILGSQDYTARNVSEEIIVLIPYHEEDNFP